MSSISSYKGAPRRGPVYGVKDVPAAAFIRQYAEHLKKNGEITAPEWTEYVKTGVAKELSPYDPDWYFLRIAAVARRVYLCRGVGVGALSRWFGGAKRYGAQPQHKVRSSRKIIRAVLSDLEKIGVVDTLRYVVNKTNEAGQIEEIEADQGRTLTAAGRKDLDLIARQCAEEEPEPVEEEEEDDDEEVEDDEEAEAEEDE